ncbi:MULTISPECIES: cation diffusion facilitator family transporter [unclassified Desulfurobacterium]|uniref:cation diffusion facilitator family transporter n=1 Tax=Desulfurobacterium sp. TC5-1 TaxID=1158318 RepID=UPI0003B57F1D|nr:cation diffusion facilitator family transporter [Desulfurobacterium sp. TC5-1]
MIYREKKKIALMSVFFNLILFTIKLSAGLASNSAALVADAIHSLSDLAAAVSVYAGITIANMKSKEFPYGLYKVENIVAIVSSFAIFLAGYEIAKHSLFGGGRERVTNLPVALVAIFATFILTLVFSFYERKKGEELNSPSLIADAEHVKTDMFSAAVVLVGVIANYAGYPWIEKMAVAVVVVLIFRAGFEILLESLKVLLDASIDRETLEKVKNIMLEFPEVSGIKSIRGRNSGSYKFIEAEVYIDCDSLEEAHEIVDAIEQKVKKEIPFVEKVIIHPEPYEPRKQVIAMPLDSKDRFCEGFGKCDFVLIAVVDKKRKLLESTKIYVNPVKNIERGRGIELVEFLKSKGVTCIILPKVPSHRGVLYAMAENRIKLAVVDGVRNPYEFLDRLSSENFKCQSPLIFLREGTGGSR